MNDGQLTTTNDRWILRFERDLEHPVEKVWAALTENARLKDWLSDDGTIELEVGGKVALNDHEIASTVVALEPPRLIEYGWNGPDWDGGTVRWELEPTRSGTKLVLTHQMNVMSEAEAEDFKAKHPDLPEGWEPRTSTLAGWHSILDRLEGAVDGSPIEMSMDRWHELRAHYEEKIGARRS